MPSFATGTRRLALALALTAGAFLRAQDGDLAERLYLSGERAYAARSYPEALETWGQLVQQAPRSPFAARALLALARHQVEVERHPEAALPFLERIRNEHLKTPWAAQAMLLRGQILAAGARNPDDLKEPVAEFNRVVDLFPDQPCVPAARLELGRSHRRLGEWGRALQDDLGAARLDSGTQVGRAAFLEAAAVLDLMGDTPGCLRLLQSTRDRFPGTPEAAEAAWGIQVRVKLRLQKPPLRAQGPWPEGRQKWLKTPTLLAMGPEGGLYVYQDGLGQAFRLQAGQLVPAGPVARDARALLVPAPGQAWLATARLGVVKEDGRGAPGAPPLQAPAGLALDAWGNLWVADAKAPLLQVLPPDGPGWTLALPAPASALAALPSGGAVAACNADRTFRFLDSRGRVQKTLPYGKDLPAPFRSVTALASDPLGHLAALVEGDFEGLAVWGPDGTLLRSATFKALGLSGRFRAVALDRQGGLILADRSSDTLIRVD